MAHKVLVVDDSIVMARQLTKLLLDAGYEVVGHANNGVEALKLYAALSPDVVLMDIVMPTMDGIEALRALVKQDPKARVVVISSLGGVGSKVETAFRLGACGIVTKPFESAQVCAALARALAGQG